MHIKNNIRPTVIKTFTGMCLLIDIHYSTHASFHATIYRAIFCFVALLFFSESLKSISVLGIKSEHINLCKTFTDYYKCKKHILVNHMWHFEIG